MLFPSGSSSPLRLPFIRCQFNSQIKWISFDIFTILVYLYRNLFIRKWLLWRQIKYPPSYSSFSSSLITHCFFQWLKRYLLQGYAINQKRLFEAKEKFNELQETISFLQEKSKHELLSGQEQEILNLLANYSKTLTLLEQYDLVPSCLFIFLIKIITYTRIAEKRKSMTML